jgi:protoheme IX farnesyltransferase
MASPDRPADSELTIRPGRPADFATLTKPRLNLLVLFTTLAGFYLASPAGVQAALLVHTLLGTALVAGGASALNQVWERETDGLMRRTQKRPLPGGRLSVSESTSFGILLSVLGLSELALGVNFVAAAVALVTLTSYVVVYTPLKSRTWHSTLVGAFPGALPPVIGWAAATGEISWGAASLFAIVFLWQMPHFFAIAWMYREDYSRAGLPLLPVIEPDGRSTGRQAWLYAVALVVASETPAYTGLAGTPYLVVAAVLGVMIIGLAVDFSRALTQQSARRLFLASITYLPVLWGTLVVDRLWLQ